MQLTVDEVLVDGDRIAARVSVRGNDRTVFLGLPLQGALAPWSAVDFLRVAGDRVIETRPVDGMPALIEPLARVAIEQLPVSPYRLGLVRLTIEPGATMPGLSARGPALLLVERGNLALRVDRPVAVSRAGRDGAGEREEIASGTVELAAGDHIALAAGTGYGLWSIGSEPAIVLSAATLAGDGAISNRWVRARPLDEILFTVAAPEYVARASAPSSWPPGVRGELLASGIVTTRPTSPATLKLARLTLRGNGELPLHDAPGAEMLAVEDGSAVVDLAGGEGAVRPWADASLARIGPQRESLAGRSMSPGGSAILQPGASAAVRGVGNEPLILLILTVEHG
jgi:hypothetical protein